MDEEKAIQKETLGLDTASETDRPPTSRQELSPGHDKETQPSDLDHENRLQPHASTVSSFVATRLSLPHEIAFVATICTIQVCTQAGLLSTLAQIHIIGETFGSTSSSDSAWLIAAYSLTVGSFILVSGRLGDLFGHKRLVVIGFWWFAVWSMVVGLSVYSGQVMFIVARAFQGIGPAILMPNGLAILGSAYPPGPRKHMAFAAFGGCAPTGGVMGGLFGGLFALAWWPWTHFAFAIALFGLGIVSIFIIPEPTRDPLENLDLRQKLAQIDILGAATGISALVLINIAWNQGPIAGWETPYVYVILIIGVLLVPVFFYVETKVAVNPLLPVDALTPTVGYVLACLACGWGCFGIWIYYLWQILLELRHASPLLATAQLAPVIICGALAAFVTGLMLSRIGPAWTMLCALSAFLTGICLTATMPIHQSYWAQTFVACIVSPFGMDMSFPAATVILSDAVRKEHQGIGASLVATVVNYSISVALGFAGTAEVHQNNGGLTPEDALKGYHAGGYVGIGLAGLGWVIAAVFVAKGYLKSSK